MNEHYFTANPSKDSNKKTISVKLNGQIYRLYTDSGVFSNTRLDLGTEVLLKKAPIPAETGTFLDAGCGWGPISLSLGLYSPEAEIYSVDVNERSVELTDLNAKTLGLENIHALEVQNALKYFSENNIKFDLIWSNPPIRVGKEAFHSFLKTYLDLLKDNGIAYLVVQKNLGADTCIKWLNEQGYVANKYASQKGFRIIEVTK
ncbi:class I SAM-dependent methyltransferase [Actinomyces sp. zg-332]|uniref:class I SAM-dependent methyltransferase n=1 Tax=Actinomyces sp. zg-332 TaxID=2708340 RepID=UPI001E2B7A2F|nr:methyltransferase [Actinomyces sp. zg-332]